MNPVDALERIAFLLERAQAPAYRVRAFRRAAGVIRALPPGEVEQRAAAGTLERLPGIGSTTAQVVLEAVAGGTPGYLERLESEAGGATAGEAEAAGRALRAALRGDCHLHSDWSDGGSPIEEMARAAIGLGHEWAVLTDHSPRLTVARGLSADRLRQQLDVLEALGEELAPFRLLSGIECDILADGGLDQEPDLLGELDVVVASVHSRLRMPGPEMTRRLVAAVSNPLVDVLAHCTGRIVTGKGRPESEFDPEEVFTACAEHGTAVEINSRPERLDPPRRLIRQAVEAGTLFSVDSDAHAPGQLDWQINGCARAEECGVPPDHVITTWSVERLLGWTRAKR